MPIDEKKNGIIGEKLRQLREDKGLSMSAISAEFGISLGAYQKYENNTRDVSTTLLKTIADFYHVSTDYLLGRTAVREMNVLGKHEYTEEEVRNIDSELLKNYTALPVELRRAFIRMLEEMFEITFDIEEEDESENGYGYEDDTSQSAAG